MVTGIYHRKHARKSFLTPEFMLVFLLAFIILVFSLPGKLSGRDASAQEPRSGANVPSGSVGDSAVQMPSYSTVSSRLSASLGPNATIIGLEYLSEVNLSSLARSQPVIYGNITAPVYRATVNEGGKTFLILYDFGSGMVLRRFEVIGVQLN